MRRSACACARSRAECQPSKFAPCASIRCCTMKPLSAIVTPRSTIHGNLPFGPRIGLSCTTMRNGSSHKRMYAISLSPNGVNVGRPHAGAIVFSSIMERAWRDAARARHGTFVLLKATEADRDRLGARARAELSEDRPQLIANGVRRRSASECDLAIGQSALEVAEHFCFAPSQAVVDRAAGVAHRELAQRERRHELREA